MARHRQSAVQVTYAQPVETYVAPQAPPPRSWVAENAIWFIPAWTWLVVFFTGLTIFVFVRADLIGGWFAAMSAVGLITVLATASVIEDAARAKRNGLNR